MNPDSPNLKPTSEIRKIRPVTPHLDMIEIRELKKIDSSQLTKNFSILMKQIVDYGNENFLNGDLNLIEYIISKYANVDTKDLLTIEKFSIKIISDFGLLNIFGGYLPNLNELKLNDSTIPSISDIGSNFINLKILHVNNCNLKDLSGLICFQRLEVLEASSNKIEDLIDLDLCSSIVKLNLSNNLIEKDENLFFLSNMINLRQLNLSDNPISKKDNYKNLIQEYLSSLDVLDKEFEDDEIEKNMYSTSSSINNLSYLQSRPDTSNVKLNENNDELKQSLNSDTIQSIKCILKNKKGENDTLLSPVKKNRFISEEETLFRSSRTSSISKNLKPVIVKKTCEVDEMLANKMIEEEKKLAKEIISNLDKTNRSKNKIIQNEHLFRKSLRVNNDAIKIDKEIVEKIDKHK